MKNISSIDLRSKQLALLCIFRSAILCLLLILSTTASAFCTRTDSWTEDVLLLDGRVIKVEREVCHTFQFVSGDEASMKLFASWPDKYWIKFEHPDTRETIRWQGEQYFGPALLGVVDGVPYLVVHGRPDKKTEAVYGCPDLPYIFLKYDQKGLLGKWVPISVTQAPAGLRDANLSQGEVSLDSSRHASLSEVQWNIQKVEGSSGGNFQAKIPRSYDDWYSAYKESDRYERRANDCRPPPVRPLPSQQFEATRQRINDAGLKAETVSATTESLVATPEIVSAEGFSASKGVWTGNIYLSNRCKDVVRTTAPIRAYFENGSWNLTGVKLVLNSGEEIPFQETSLSPAKAPALPQLVTCGNRSIYAVRRENKDNLLLYYFSNSGEVIGALRISLPDVDKVATGKGWGEIWEVIPLGDRLSIVLADYTYTSTANLGGTINRKQVYSADLSRFRQKVLHSARPETDQTVDQASTADKSKAAGQSAISSFRDCPGCPEMIAIPGTTYAIGKYEVTQAEWKLIVGTDNLEARHSLKGDNMPAIHMMWSGTQKFISRLNKETGKNYRLPTEAEWEHACYGGTQTSYCGGDDIETVAWYKGNSRFKLRPVGQKKPNGYGLYDMSGNVWEWVNDCWKGKCDLRIVRGGSFNYHPLRVRDAYLYGKASPGEDIGFRLLRTLP